MIDMSLVHEGARSGKGASIVFGTRRKTKNVAKKEIAYE